MSANKSRDANIFALTFDCQRAEICRADTKYRANIVTVISSANDRSILRAKNFVTKLLLAIIFINN